MAGNVYLLPSFNRLLVDHARIGMTFYRPQSAGKSENLSKALNRLGPSWVKLGQFLATRPDVVGTDIATDLEQLQDRMAPFGAEQAKQMVAATLGCDVDEVFTSFGNAVVAASVAQVHKATVMDGEAERIVAVKVIRPGVRDRFNRDLRKWRKPTR